MALSADYKKELRRKLFHVLSLIYLAAFHLFGVRWFLYAMGVFIFLEAGLEFARLRSPAFNQRLMGMFADIHREAELKKISAVLWTSLGCMLTAAVFGSRPAVVSAAFLYLAFGDGIAALAGKAWGRTVFRVGGRKKSLEGSAACLVVCLASGWAAGLTPAGAVAGAVTATVIELFPVPPDDNFWIPFASACVLSLF